MGVECVELFQVAAAGGVDAPMDGVLLHASVFVLPLRGTKVKKQHFYSTLFLSSISPTVPGTRYR